MTEARRRRCGCRQRERGVVDVRVIAGVGLLDAAAQRKRYTGHAIRTVQVDAAYEIATQLERAALCTVWTNGVFFAGGYPLESLEKAVTASDFAIAIAQPDDIVSTRDKTHKTVRDNVVFELGLFMGHLTRHQAFLIHPRVDELKLPSDMLGLNLLSYSIGKPDELPARIGPACNELRKIIVRLGVKTSNAGA